MIDPAAQPAGSPHVGAHRTTLVWLIAAALLGFLVSALFSWWLGWPRSLFLIPYVVLIGGFLALFFRSNPISRGEFVGNWRFGLVGCVVASALILYNIQGQPDSAVPEGAALGLALLWTGLIYGAIDGFFLNVMPVLCIYPRGAGAGLPLRIRFSRGLLALLIFVTVAYHAGYAEFHGSVMLLVILGNAIVTLAYLLSGSPAAAVATHIVMHLAAVLRGMETTLQLPPHFAIP